uniref:beta strand repeat-containing protein n=1 Tax=Perlucidibaca aquatica TaxID=1852776 RepID=UPI000AC4E327
STTAGDISLTAKNSVTIGSILKSLLGKIGVKAETGSITTEGDAPISATKDVTLLADTDIVIDDTIATTEGNVSLTATKGSITLNDNLSTSSTATRDATSGKFAAGNVMLTAKTDVTQNADILVKNGDVSVTATEGNLKMTTGKKTDITNAGNIVYSAGKQIDSEILATKLGDITLTAGTDLLANNTITTQGGAVKLTATAGKIDTDIDAAISATKDVTLTADTNITVGDAVSTTAGDIALKTAKGFVTLNDTLTTNATAARVDGTFADGNITVDAATSITQNADITLNKGDLTLTANAGDLLQNANSKLNEGNALLTAKATTGANPTGGNITMRDAGANNSPAATRIDVASGNVTLTADNNINVAALSVADANTVTLKATNGAITGQTNTTLHVQAGTLDAAAKTGIGNALRTSLNKLIAKVTGTGDINIEETNAIELTQVSTNSGTFNLKAGDDVLARDVAINGSATFDVKGKLTTAVATSDPMTSAGQIAAKDLTVTAEDGVNISTAVDRADVVLSKKGGIVISEADSITLERLSTTDGDIEATSAGTPTSPSTMTVKRVVAGGETSTATLTSTTGSIVQAADVTAPAVTASSTVLSASSGIGTQTSPTSTSPLTLQTDTLKATSTSGDIVLAQNGALALDEVSTSGNINLAITGGGLTGATGMPNSLTGNQVKVTAQGAVFINTNAGSLLDIDTTGDIAVVEKDGVTRANLTAANVSATSTTGDLGIGSIVATDANGAVTLVATTGAILDADNDDATKPVINITAQSLNATAAQGIGRAGQVLETAIGTLTAKATQSGGVFFNNPGSFIVASVTANGGDIALQTSETLTQTGPVSTSGSGDITVSGQTVTMTPTASTQAGSGTINYSATNAVTISSLVAKTGLGGGAVTVKAPTVNTVNTGRPNITGWIIDVSGDNVDLPRIQLLIGEQGLESALIKQGFQVVGGTLANSRQFMEQILMPLQVEGNLPVNGALSRGLSPVSAPQLNTYNGFTEQLNGEWIFRL